MKPCPSTWTYRMSQTCWPSLREGLSLVLVYSSLGIVPAVGSHLFRVFILDASGFLIPPSIRTDHSQTQQLRVTSLRPPTVRSSVADEIWIFERITKRRDKRIIYIIVLLSEFVTYNFNKIWSLKDGEPASNRWSRLFGLKFSIIKETATRWQPKTKQGVDWVCEVEDLSWRD